MKPGRLLIILLAASVLCSCNDKVQKNNKALPYVEKILSKSESREFRLLKSGKKVDPQNEVFIIGSHSPVWRLANLLCDSDNFDNIDGKRVKDFLPDFAGEYFCLIADSLGRDYNHYIQNGTADSLRELCVRYCLSALDTVSYLSIYDDKGLGLKKPAKIVIIADPQLSAYGKYDVDTLFKASGCGVSVLSPADLTFAKVCANSKLQLNIGVICTGSDANSEMYRIIMNRYACPGSSVTAINITNKANGALQEFLTSYAAMGGTKALDALIVDDSEVLISGLETDLGGIKSMMMEDSRLFGDYINPDFKIVSTDKVFEMELFRIMRENDLFTHDIRVPGLVEYITLPFPSQTQPYMLISTNVQN